MKKLFLAIIFVTLVAIFIIGCQAPQDVKAQMDKQTEQIKALETKLAENTAKIEQLKVDYEKHITDFHKKALIGKPGPQPIKPTPPPKIGR